MEQVPAKILKRIAGTCLYSGCSEKAIEGSDYCAPHDAHERGRDAAKKRRTRQERADAGKCITGCGRKVPRKKRGDGTVLQRRCSACKKSLRAERPSVPGEPRSVPGDSDERITRQVEGDGYARTRYHGQPRRGQQKRWQLDVQDFRAAIECLKRAIVGVEQARDAEAAGIPRIQCDEIRMAAMAQGVLGQRFIEDSKERNGYESK